MTHKFFAYNNGSASAKLLSRALGWKMLKRAGSKFHYHLRDTIINWGSSSLHYKVPSNAHYINHPFNVRVVSNKGLYAQAIINNEELPFRSISFTQDRNTAQQWLNEGNVVVARSILNGSEGRGIIIVKPGEVLPVVKLYSKYQPKESEYRVHVINGEVVKVQQKLRRKEQPVPPGGNTFRIRNTANGFRFCTVEEYPEDVAAQAIAAVNFFGLDFGGVDVIYKKARLKRDARAYVVEINTAPGIEGGTVETYASKFRQYFGER